MDVCRPGQWKGFLAAAASSDFKANDADFVRSGLDQLNCTGNIVLDVNVSGYFRSEALCDSTDTGSAELISSSRIFPTELISSSRIFTRS